MKFLIIGASGFVGRHTLKHISSLGYEAIGTKCRDKSQDLIFFNLLSHRIKDRIDASFFQTNKTIFGIICACISQIDLCFKERDVNYVVNVQNTFRLIKDLEALGVRPVFISSSFVYSGIEGYYNEEHPHSPICEYGRHKAAVEDLIKKDASNTLVLRLDKIVGDDPLEKHMLSEWYQLIKEKRSIACIEEQLFSPTFVKDVAKAIVLSCQKKLTGLYNVANSEFFKRDELARHFVQAAGRKCEVISKPQEEFDFLDKRPLKSYLDSTKFVKTTDFRFTSMRDVFNILIQKATNQDV